MLYVVSYITPFDEQVFNILTENEYKTLMVHCDVLFKSNNFDEVEFYYNELVK